MFLLIIILFILGLLLWILLVPVTLFINTTDNRYFVRLPGIISAAIVPSEELFHIRGWIFFVPYRFHPFRPKKKKGKQKKQGKKDSRKPKKKSKRTMPAGGIQTGIDAVRSVRIRRLALDIDTDDLILNSRLIPVFSWLNSDRIHLTANFEGRASLLMDIRLQLGTLLWVFIRNRIKSFY